MSTTRPNNHVQSLFESLEEDPADVRIMGIDEEGYFRFIRDEDGRVRRGPEGHCVEFVPWGYGAWRLYLEAHREDMREGNATTW